MVSLQSRIEATTVLVNNIVGQTRQVFAYRLICQGTVEEKISELQQQKRELADAILEQNNTVLQSLTADDLKLLLS